MVPCVCLCVFVNTPPHHPQNHPCLRCVQNKQSFFNCLLDMAAMDKTNSRTGSLCIDPNSAEAISSQTHLLQGYANGHANGHSAAHHLGGGGGGGVHHVNGGGGDTSLTALARRTNSVRNRSLRWVQLDRCGIDVAECRQCYSSQFFSVLFYLQEKKGDVPSRTVDRMLSVP